MTPRLSCPGNSSAWWEHRVKAHLFDELTLIRDRSVRDIQCVMTQVHRECFKCGIEAVVQLKDNNSTICHERGVDQ